MADSDVTTLISTATVVAPAPSYRWECFFSALEDLLRECELLWGTNDPITRERFQIRLEHAILSLQQVLPFLNHNRTTLEEVLRNMCTVHEWWYEQRESSCTQTAVYLLDIPEVLRTGNPGRPKYVITEEVLLNFRSAGFSWKAISELLYVSRWTLQRRVAEFRLKDATGFTPIHDDELDGIVREFMQNHGTLVGYSLVSGHLRSLGYRIQRDRVRLSIARVDPENSRIRWAAVISRRTYSVPGPNSLWHVDGHHSLVTWGFVIHGGIDGFSRLVVFLSCSTNNRSDTVREKFIAAAERYEWPSRVITDMSGENVGIWEIMEEVRGENRGSYLTGSSTQNQRIERLWRDVFRVVTHMYYYTFQSMEEAGLLDRNNLLHMFILHYIYLPRINKALESFISAWNYHPIRTEHNWSPVQIWTNGMIDLRNRGLTAVADVVGTECTNQELYWYGYDPQSPHPSDDGLSSVVVDDINLEIPDHVTDQLKQNVNEMGPSESFGIDHYNQALQFVVDFYQTSNQ